MHPSTERLIALSDEKNRQSYTECLASKACSAAHVFFFFPVDIYLFKMFSESILVVTVGTPYASVLIRLQRSNSVTL